MSDDAWSMVVAALRRLEEKTDTLQTGLDDGFAAVRADISVNMARADRVAGAGENTREEMRLLATELNAMWRKVNRLEENVRAIERGGNSGRAT